jgi:DNA repair protein RadD
MTKLRGYQDRAVRSTLERFATGVSSVCLVAPTGSGKTRMGEEVAASAEHVVWVAHRRELVQQAAGRLAARFGRSSVGMVMPGEQETADARMQVGTVQTLLARDLRPDADLLVLDEAHHYAAHDWRQLREHYAYARVLGLTATPERRDGEPLGDVFQELIVAASYSELIAAGYLVPCRVFQPPENLGNDLAQDPLEAWGKYSAGRQTFVFCARVDGAHMLAQRFRDAGILAASIEAETPTRERDDTLRRFRAGKIRVLTNVGVLTEGIDVPEASVVEFARGFGHVGGFLQAVGRVLRPAKGKTHATLIDLTGSTLKHGLPTDDRDYSLGDRPISGEAPERGEAERPEFQQSIRGLELSMVGADAVQLPLPEPVAMQTVDLAEREAEYRRLLALCRQHRMRDGFAAVKYREKFGEGPRREWA